MITQTDIKRFKRNQGKVYCIMYYDAHVDWVGIIYKAGRNGLTMITMSDEYEEDSSNGCKCILKHFSYKYIMASHFCNYDTRKNFINALFRCSNFGNFLTDITSLNKSLTLLIHC